jgi:uncharacterized protein
MEFEWDSAKDRTNYEKHGVDFEYTSRIFSGPMISWPDVRRDYGETRTHSVGSVDNVVVLAVIHTDREGKIRIISARLTDRIERKIYETSIRKTAHH